MARKIFKVGDQCHVYKIIKREKTDKKHFDCGGIYFKLSLKNERGEKTPNNYLQCNYCSKIISFQRSNFL